MSKRSKKYIPRKKKKVPAKKLRSDLLALFRKNPKKRYNAPQIIRKLNLSNSKDSVEHALEILADESHLTLLAAKKYKLNLQGPIQGTHFMQEGTVDMTKTGSAYIVCDEIDDDVFVPARALNTALHGDKVKVYITRKGRRNPEGKVIQVLERSRDHFIGTLFVHRKYSVVVPESLKPLPEIVVSHDDIKDAHDRDKVIVKVTDWPTKPSHDLRGKVTTVLGKAGSNDVEMKSILINNGFNIQFPEEVLTESRKIAEKMPEEEIKSRRDMRTIPTCTIDPADAKDFDDALSYRNLGQGHYEIGIHIADVTYYVEEGSALDKEARKRSTSVYLVDRVCPMLPERLSNELCSLRPNEDKFCFSAVFEFDEKDTVRRRWFGRTVIHSNRRFSYDEAQQVIETGKGDLAKEILEMNRVAKVLRKRKYRNGAIGFETDEVRFKLDENAKPIGVYLKKRKDAHMMIEDFMLLANREVASYISRKGRNNEVPFVYRVHDTPDEEKLYDFQRFAKEMGYKMDLSHPDKARREMHKLGEAAEKNDNLQLLIPLAIRTMAKAIYTSDNIGHYALAFNYYTHFTSPIRRYADVLVHRLLQKNLDGTYRTDKGKLEARCKYISKIERNAQDAERESVKYKQVEFMEEHIGDTFDGLITGMIDRGIFVSLVENHCEGMVSFGSMKQGYDVQQGRHKATGNRNQESLKIGDGVKVRITDVDLSRREIDMELAE